MYNAHMCRMNRLFRASGKCLDVAIDHGAFNEAAFLDGLEDMEAVYQHSNPGRIVECLLAMIHDGAGARQAWERYSQVS